MVFGFFLIAGFVSFTAQFSGSSKASIQKADAIVVFTGAHKRIEIGLDLFSKKSAPKMLISGVNTNISRRYLASKHKRFSKLINCCISLDYDALDTVGNARETAKWLHDKNVKSLIVVTSGYHLPRSVLLLQRELPDVKIIPHPVTSSAFDTWWTDYKTTKVVALEYAKYIASLFNIDSTYSDTDIALARSI